MSVTRWNEVEIAGPEFELAVVLDPHATAHMHGERDIGVDDRTPHRSHAIAGMVHDGDRSGDDRLAYHEGSVPLMVMSWPWKTAIEKDAQPTETKAIRGSARRG